MDYCVITFASTHGAIYTQQQFKGRLAFLVMPVLREISLGCGISVRIAPEDLELARSILAGSELRAGEYAFYAVTGSGPTLQARALDGAPAPRCQAH